MRARRHACVLLLAALTAAASLAAIQSPVGSMAPGSAGNTFSLDEILTIQGFFRGKGAANRPIMESAERQIGPAARQTLKVGAILHGDLRRTALPLPAALESALSPIPPGVRRLCAGQNILLVDRNFRVSDLLQITFDNPKAAPAKSGKK